MRFLMRFLTYGAITIFVIACFATTAKANDQVVVFGDLVVENLNQVALPSQAAMSAPPSVPKLGRSKAGLTCELGLHACP